MAKKEQFFSHDMSARRDPKISAMLSVYGSRGYGWFWMLVEMMAETDGYQLDCKSKYTWNAYAMQMQCTAEEVHNFVSDCINEFDLFMSDGEHFWSNSLRKRMEYRDKVSATKSAAAQRRWEKEKGDAYASKNDADAMQDYARAMQTDANLNINNKHIKHIVDSDECDIAFEKWYSIYPKQGSIRKTAHAKWNSLWKSKKISMDELMNGTHSYLAYQDYHQYKVCGAQVFLNQERWKDDWTINTSGGFTKGPKEYVSYRTIPQPDVSKGTDEEMEWLRNAAREQDRRRGITFDDN